jgi:hypothetical protein
MATETAITDDAKIAARAALQAAYAEELSEMYGHLRAAGVNSCSGQW